MDAYIQPGVLLGPGCQGRAGGGVSRVVRVVQQGRMGPMGRAQAQVQSNRHR